MKFLLPIRTINESNDHSHWRTRQRRAKAQRAAARLAAQANCPVLPTLPCVVMLTRISPGTLDDDGLVSSQKHVRDGIADWIGVDDRHSEIVKYEYAQERGKPAGVRVEIREMQKAEAV